MRRQCSEQSATQGLVVICTRNRPRDLRMSLAAVQATAPQLEVLVADSSDGSLAAEVHSVVDAHKNATLLTCTPGLARQRNQSLEWVATERPDVPFLFFIDDDTEVLPGYFEAVVEKFETRPEVAGVGGVVVNHPRPRHRALKALFWLYGPIPGRVLPSGRLTIGHYQGQEATDPQCLPGCAMSYRTRYLNGRRFDDRLEGYSLGEDLYFSFALSAHYPLAIAPDARVRHHFSPANRLSRVRLQREKVALLHRFVRENRDRGLRERAFWWSVFGDMLLRFVDGVARADRDSISEARAILSGALMTMRRPLTAHRPRNIS